MARTKITIDHERCGDGKGIDPRECRKCMTACAPDVLVLHPTPGAVELDPLDPKGWRVTAMWAAGCNRCGTCVKVCAQKAIHLTSVGFWGSRKLS